MAQNIIDYSDNPTGPELLDNYLSKEQENNLSSNSGIQRPSYATAGTLWIDTSTQPWLFKLYDGTNDVTIGAVDTTSHNFIASGVDGSNLVHKTGTETITGNKTLSGSSTFSGSATFQANIIQSNASPVVYLKNTSMTKGTAPSEESIVFVRFRDSANKDMGALRYGYGTNKQSKVSLRANKANASGDTAVAELMLAYPASGNPYATCPTPTENNTSSVQIDTVGARNTQINAILSALYPVGSIYIGTQSSCPLATLISGSTWTKISGDKVLQSSSSNHSANTTISAGLPNIEGRYNHQCLMNETGGTKIGALYTRNEDTDTASQLAGGTAGTTKKTIAFDASKSNSIYGNSSTVQPPAYVVNVWRRTA